MTETTTVPSGYWKDANDNLVPTSKIKDIDKDRHRVTTQLCEAAKVESARLVGFKTTAMAEVLAFIERSYAEYDVKVGGAKGNVTLVSFDGRYKVERTMQDSLTFDERLQAAKEILDECARLWAKGSNANLKPIINGAFQLDKKGKISLRRVLDLRRHKIEDPRWLQGMRAIDDSLQVSSTKPYIRFYERDDASGQYVPITLDVAAV